MSGIPRAKLNEVLARWEFEGLPLILVEGLYDQRTIELVQSENYCPKAVQDIDVWTVAAVEINSDLVRKHGIDNNGEKQRVIAFIREMESQKKETGFRGIVDRDIDNFVPVSYSSTALLYTDHGSMEGFSWTESIFRLVLIQFNCQLNYIEQENQEKIFNSITKACRLMAYIRAAAHRHGNFAINNSEKNIHFNKDGEIFIDWEKYLLQCKIKGDDLPAVKKTILSYIDEYEINNEHTFLNGHDLMWLTTVAIKNCTRGPVRQVEQSLVENSFLAFGIAKKTLEGSKLLSDLIEWQTPKL